MIPFFNTSGGANRTVEEALVYKNKKYDIFDTKLIADIFDRVLHKKVIGFEKPLNIGLPHVSYVVHLEQSEDLFFRANLGPIEPEVQLVKEQLTSDIARAHGLPANHILHVDISRSIYPFDYQIQEMVKGLDAEIEFHGTKEDYDTFSFSLGQWVAKLSDIPVDGFGQFSPEKVIEKRLVGESATFYDYIQIQLEEEIQEIEHAGFITSHTAEKLREVFISSQSLCDCKKSSLVHYDLADHNLRYDPKTFEVSAIFDWEASVAGDTVLDLASCPTWKTLYPREEKLLEGYLSLKPRPDHLVEKMKLFKLRTILWKVCQNIKFSIFIPERQKRFEDALALFGLEMKV